LVWSTAKSGFRNWVFFTENHRTGKIADGFSEKKVGKVEALPEFISRKRQNAFPNLPLG